MGFDSGWLDDELGGDLGVGRATREQAQHVVFAGGQPGQGRRLIRHPGELLDQPAGADGREERVTGVRGPDGGDQLGRRCGLEQEPGSAGPERIHNVLVEVECRQHHHADPGESCPGAAVSAAALAVNGAFLGTSSVPALLLFVLWMLLASLYLVRRAWRQPARITQAQAAAST